MVRYIVAFSLTVLAAASAHAGNAEQQDPRFLATCRYFENRATSERAGERGTWLALLAGSCGAALHRHGGKDAGPGADRLYLERLTVLRDVVVRMNVVRFTERDGNGHGGPSILRSVSGSGEYLIARHLGIMDAYRTWRDASQIDTAALPDG